MIPPPVEVSVPRLLGGEIRVKGYSLSMVIAEKLVTALERTTVNTRWRDFADVLLLSRRHSFAGAEVSHSAAAVAAHRGVALATLTTALQGYGGIGQGRWSAWVRKERLADRVPLDFTAVIGEVTAFGDPILDGSAAAVEWSPSSRRWV